MHGRIQWDGFFILVALALIVFMVGGLGLMTYDHLSGNYHTRIVAPCNDSGGIYTRYGCQYIGKWDERRPRPE